MTTIVKCPTCQKQVSWIEENQYRPFCCERCKLIDLGEWANEKHKISDKNSANKWNEFTDENDI